MLFGEAFVQNSFFRTTGQSIPVLEEVRKDWPENGDVTGCWCQQDGASHLIHIVQNEREPESFRSLLVLKAPCKFVTQPWSGGIFCDLIDLTYQTVKSELNRPNLRKLRVAETEFYTVLALRSFNRGPPLLPNSEERDSCVTVSTEKPHLRHWSKSPMNHLHLSDYLTSLAERLGYELKTSTMLNGKRLAPFQCVVEIEAFQKVRGPLLEALRVQKAAYRRANGGTAAPSLMEAWIYHQPVALSHAIDLYSFPGALNLALLIWWLNKAQLAKRHENSDMRQTVYVSSLGT